MSARPATCWRSSRACGDRPAEIGGLFRWAGRRGRPRLVEPPLAVFIASVPLFKVLTNSALPRAVRMVGEVLEGAAKPVGSDAEGVIQLSDQGVADVKVVAPKAGR